VITLFGIELATIGLLNILVVSKFNDMMYDRREKINRQIGKCRDVVNTRGISNQRKRLLDLNIDSLENVLHRLSCIPRRINYPAFLSLGLLLGWFVSSLIAESYLTNLRFLSPIFLTLSIVSLSVFVIWILYYVDKYLQAYELPKNNAVMKLLDFNNSPIANKHDLQVDFKKLPDILPIKVNVKGNFTNGFVDSHYVCCRPNGDIYQIWIPDPVTYLSNTGEYNTGIGLAIESWDYDTGILQKNIDQTIELMFCIRNFIKNSSKYHLLDTNNDVIDRIEIDVFVDPVHLPRVERRNLRTETIIIRNI
jgi:hypothetical protein